MTGALNNKAPKELEEKVHPLGVFEGMKVIMSESFDVQGVGVLGRPLQHGKGVHDKGEKYHSDHVFRFLGDSGVV